MPTLTYPGCAAWLPRRLAGLLVALGLGASLAGCASVKASPTLTAAVTLDELGAVFIQTGQQYNDLYRAGALDADTYRDWARFAEAFKQAWIAAYAVIEAGGTGGDTVETVFALKAALFQYAMQVITLKAQQEKGTPS